MADANGVIISFSCYSLQSHNCVLLPVSSANVLHRRELFFRTPSY